MEQEQLNNEQQVLMNRIKDKSKQSKDTALLFLPLLGIFCLTAVGSDLYDMISSQVWDVKSISELCTHLLYFVGIVLYLVYRHYFSRQICACETAADLLSTNRRCTKIALWGLSCLVIAFVIIKYVGAASFKSFSFVVILLGLLILIVYLWFDRKSTSDIERLRNLVNW